VAKPASRRRGEAKGCAVCDERRRKRHEVKVRKQKSKDKDATPIYF
jgi:hypothetical protein